VIRQLLPKRRALLGAVLLAGLPGACGKATKLPQVPAGEVVLAFGDSVTYGTGAGPGEDWPRLLAARSGWNVVNAGIPGDTAEAGRQRIQALLDRYRPALVIVEIGGNDFLRRRPSPMVKEDLRDIIRQVRASGAQVVLLAVPELSLLGVVARKPADSPIYGQLAKEEKILLIRDLFSAILGRPELCADQIHPNAAGYREMAAGIVSELQRAGLIAASGP